MRKVHQGNVLAFILGVACWVGAFGYGLYQVFFGLPYVAPQPKPTHRHSVCTRYNDQPLLGGGYYYVCEE